MLRSMQEFLQRFHDDTTEIQLRMFSQFFKDLTRNISTNSIGNTITIPESFRKSLKPCPEIPLLLLQNFIPFLKEIKKSQESFQNLKLIKGH